MNNEKEAKAKAEIKARGGEYEAAFYTGRVLAFTLSLIQALIPFGLFVFLMWALSTFGLSGWLPAIIAFAIVAVILWFTDWGNRWIGRHKKLLMIGNPQNKN